MRSLENEAPYPHKSHPFSQIPSTNFSIYFTSFFFLIELSYTLFYSLLPPFGHNYIMGI